MIKGTPADLTWVHVPSHVPVIGLVESADSMMITCLFGVMHYSREKDSEALAAHLEQVAKMVRDHA